MHTGVRKGITNIIDAMYTREQEDYKPAINFNFNKNGGAFTTKDKDGKVQWKSPGAWDSVKGASKPTWGRNNFKRIKNVGRLDFFKEYYQESESTTKPPR